VDWERVKACLVTLHREAQPFLSRALLIGGAACWFYRHLLERADERDRSFAAKRGNGIEPASLSTPTAESSPGLQIADPASAPDDARFDREWALLLLDRAYATLANEWAAAGRAHHFEILKPWLIGDAETLSQSEAARQHGMREGAVRVAIHRLRKRFRLILHDDIAQTLEDSSDVKAELRHFARVVASVPLPH